MRNDVERFLQVLEAERGFSLNTISAYRNDLNQFVAFLGQDGAGSEAGAGSVGPILVRWEELTDEKIEAIPLLARLRAARRA